VVGTVELGCRSPHCGDELEALRALADELGIVVDLDGNGRRQAARSGKATFYLEAGRLHWLNEGAPAEG
jgi:hypothetical protein